LIDREGAAAHRTRHQLGDIGVDGDDLDADADPGDETPQQQAAGCALARHRHRRRGVAKQRKGEDRPPSEPVGQEAQEERAGEQSGKGRGDEGANPRKAEKRLRGRGQQPRASESRCDVAGKEQVVDLETAAERQQDHQPPQIGRAGQAFETLRNFVRTAACGAKIKSRVDIDGAHEFPPPQPAARLARRL
jgi:hypothetical protein